MCGLIGIAASHLTARERDLYKGLSFLTCFRGIHSTGVVTVTREKGGYQNHYFKKAVNPVTFINTKVFNGMMEDAPCAILGHSRFATQGTINDDNAHPYEVGNLLGMHNGVVRSFNDPKRDVTDSQILYERIVKQGLEKTLAEARYGAYALVWSDFNNNTINFVRNADRPLHYMRGHGGIILWASEARMLSYIKDANKSMFHAEAQPIQFDTGVLYTMNYGDVSLRETKLDIPAPVYQGYRPYAPWEDADWEEYSAPKKTEVKRKPAEIAPSFDLDNMKEYPYNPVVLTKPKEREPAEPKESDVSIPTLYTYQGFNGQEMGYHDAVDLLAKLSCSWCSDHHSPDDELYWLSDDSYLCGSCYEDEELQAYCAGKVHKGKVKMNFVN